MVTGGYLLSNYFNKKHWRNVSDYCNGKTHPSYFPYRRYKRGKNRCGYCGAKLGKVKCEMKTGIEMIQDNIFHSNLLVNILNNRGGEEL